MHRSFYIYIIILAVIISCKKNEESPLTETTHQNTNLAITNTLLESIEVYPNVDCDDTLEKVLNNWQEHSLPYTDLFDQDVINSQIRKCLWTRLLFRNEDSVKRTRILYFPKGWKHLECFSPEENGTYSKNIIGVERESEVLIASLPPLKTVAFYVKYPEKAMAYMPQYAVKEMSVESYNLQHSKTMYKYMLLGIIIFPLLFFLIQYLVQKDKLSLYYLVFLIGSFSYLLTMLDTIPFFELSPKLISSMDHIQRLFVCSTLLTFVGLVKYIHCFLDVSSWSIQLTKTGNILLMVFLAIVLVPLVYAPIFQAKNYIIYLQYFRICALVVFVYTLFLIIWAVFKKVKFSRTLLLSFSPFVIGGVWYATSFILVRGYAWLDYESLLLIIGFMFTLLLFGVVLGVRNNAIKGEKLKLEQKAERLKELDQFKSRFYTNITHEFRTPLTVIKGMTGMISSNDRIKAIILRNSDRILNMVNQLLDLSKLESNKLKINLVNGDIIPFLKYLTESCHSFADNHGLNLAFFSEESTLLMDFDENKIQHIVVNLVSNAIKFTPAYGSVKVIVTKVLVNDVPHLKLSVNDTGNGIPQDKLVHIFDRFYQADDTPTRQGEGSGIGLSIVKEIVQLLEGRIEVKSEINRGSTFIVHLPIHHNVEITSSRIKVPETIFNNKNSEVSGTRIDTSLPVVSEDDPLVLIIEDNVDVTEYIVSCLKQKHQLLCAHNGVIGLEKAIEKIPDVILCDVMMPEMDGFEVCKRLKTDIRTSHIPIILLTSKASQEDKVVGLTHGADAYMTKPFDKDELLVRVANLIVQSERLRKQLKIKVSSKDGYSPSEIREVRFLDKLDDIIANNLHNELFDTIFLCKEIGMSRTQLYRKLKALTGHSTASFIRIARLNKAKSLIETTNLSIGEVVLRVGFKDFSHFTRSFSKRFGVTPSELRN